jgi:two-component system sensor histidine kinase RegB
VEIGRRSAKLSALSSTDVPAVTPTTTIDHAKVSLPWLARLRWGLVAGQIASVVLAYETLDVELNLARIGFFVALTVTTNLLLFWHLRMDRPVSRTLCGAVLILDTIVLTGLLRETGGSSNPFSVLYLVHITLAAVLLDARWTWGLTVLSVLGYGSLFLSHEHAGHVGHDFSSHLRGMWLAFTLTAALTASFVVRLTAAIRRRDREIEEIREQAARSERLAALTTLAAGAAHELGTPLATIAVAAGELERAVSRLPSPHAAPLLDDARLIRGQLDRCRAILDQMTAAAGEVTGEAPNPVALEEIFSSVRDALSPEDAKRLQVKLDVEGTAVVPHRAFARAVTSLVRNAFDASVQGETIDVSVGVGERDALRVTVSDRGSGMTADVLERATDPFFTTKAPGRGMGMGLFLARALAEQLGGRLLLVSTEGVGTSATLELPAHCLGPGRRQGRDV